MPLKECPDCHQTTLDYEPSRRVWRCLSQHQCHYVSEPEPTPEERIRDLEVDVKNLEECVKREAGWATIVEGERDAAQQEVARLGKLAADWAVDVHEQAVHSGYFAACVSTGCLARRAELGGKQHGP